MNRGAWQVTVHRVAIDSDTIQRLSNNSNIFFFNIAIWKIGVQIGMRDQKRVTGRSFLCVRDLP